MRADRGLRRLSIWTLLGLATALLLYQGWFFAHVALWVHRDPVSSRFMEQRLGEMRQHDPRAVLKHQWVPYANIAVHLKRAIVAAEDASFVDHEGFDWAGIQRAMEKNQKKGKFVAGGSTITQQLAKNLFLSSDRSVLRKGQEAIITAMLEATMGKRRILEIYLNVVEWGEGIFGAESAARHYFGTSAAALTPEQAARLAAMLPRPRYYDRNRTSEYLVLYTQTILARMPGAQLP